MAMRGKYGRLTLPTEPDRAAYYEQPSSSGGRMAKEKGAAAKGREGEGRPATPPRTSDADDDAAVSPSLSRSTLVGPIEK